MAAAKKPATKKPATKRSEADLDRMAEEIVNAYLGAQKDGASQSRSQRRLTRAVDEGLLRKVNTVHVNGVTVSVANKGARKPKKSCKSMSVTKAKKVFVCP